MVSLCIVFLAARNRTHGKEAMASRSAEFIAAGGHTGTWEDFESAMAEWVVDLEVAKAAEKVRKRQKAVKKRESGRHKKKEAARHGEESLAEIEARWLPPTRPRRRTSGFGQHAPMAANRRV